MNSGVSMCRREGISASTTVRTGGGSVLDQGVERAAAHEEFVDFLAAGANAVGEFQCSSCGYGVSVRSRLPAACPMCAGEAWEQKPGAPLTPSRAWTL
jgi:hypothetical protein